MKYVCRSCEKEFEFDAQLSFCPYCGGSIAGKSNITQTIDSIWGETASMKREFTSLVFVYLDKIAGLFAASCEQIKEKYLKDKVENLVYNDEMSLVSSCETRKAVLAQVERLMEKIFKAISTLPQNCVAREETVGAGLAKNSVQEYLDCMTELLDDKKLFSIQEGKYQYSTMYEKKGFEEFFVELKIAHKKYVKCVNDNNMFAAFPSNSDFGKVGRGRRFEFLGLVLFEAEEDTIEEEENVELDFDTCLSEIKKANALRYDGFLDEDFVPHVDAFWKGVSDILGLLSQNSNISFTTPSLNIDEKLKAKIRRKIAGKEFFVTSEKIEKLQVFMEQIEKLEA